MGVPGGNQNPGGDVARRRFLLRAIGAGSVALAIPTIVTVAPAAAADVRSAPPEPPQVEPTDVPRGSPQVMAAQQARTGTLPFTGADIEKPLIAGLGAIAGGGAMLFWSANKAQPTPAPAPVDGVDPGTPSA